MEKGAVGIRPLERGNDQQLLAEALRTAARADVIVAAVGECAEMSGESPSRTNLEIPDAQQDLLKALVKTGKPVVTAPLHWSSFGLELGKRTHSFYSECMVRR